MKAVDGYYVMGKLQSMAWFKEKAHAEAEVARLRMRGIVATVEPSYKPQAPSYLDLFRAATV